MLDLTLWGIETSRCSTMLIRPNTLRLSLPHGVLKLVIDIGVIKHVDRIETCPTGGLGWQSCYSARFFGNLGLAYPMWTHLVDAGYIP